MPTFLPRNIGVLGAGLMGAGIVQVSIDKGYNVIMKDATEQGLIRGITQVETGLINAVKKKKLSGWVLQYHHSYQVYVIIFPTCWRDLTPVLESYVLVIIITSTTGMIFFSKRVAKKMWIYNFILKYKCV